MDISLSITSKRLGTTLTSAHLSRPTGDISSVFPSLSGVQSPQLHPRFRDLKERLIQGHEDHVRDSWHRLLADLRQEVDEIKALGSKVVPELDFRDMHNIDKRTAFRDGLRKRGVGLIRGVVSEQEALGWKELVKRYIQTNPLTKGRQSFCLFHFGACISVIRALWDASRGNRIDIRGSDTLTSHSLGLKSRFKSEISLWFRGYG